MMGSTLFQIDQVMGLSPSSRWARPMDKMHELIWGASAYLESLGLNDDVAMTWPATKGLNNEAVEVENKGGERMD